MLRSAFMIFIFFGFTCLLNGCQTVSHKNFEDVRVGMDKATVLELIGGPQKASRLQGRDRWLYTFRSRTEGEQLREIHFDSGRVIYVGGRVAPATPAEDQDNMNQKTVIQENARADALKRQWEIDHNVAKVGDQVELKNEQDLRLHDSLFGTDLYQKSNREKRKVAPSFTPVN